MARNGESLGHRKDRFLLALVGLLLSTGGVLLQEPLLTISQNCHDKISIFLPVYAYLFLLNPLCFYLNMLLFLLHVSAHADAPQAQSHLPRAAHTVSFATLLLSAPLSFHAAVVEERVDSAIGAAMVCLALVAIFTSVFMKFFVSSFRTGRGLVPALLALCISTENLISFDPLTHHIPIHLLLSFVSFFMFMLGIALVILCIRAPANGQNAAIRAETLVIAALSVAFATLLVGGYIKVYTEVPDMAAVVGGSGSTVLLSSCIRGSPLSALMYYGLQLSVWYHSLYIILLVKCRPRFAVEIENLV